MGARQPHDLGAGILMSTSPNLSRRSLLRGVGLAGATLIVAGTGALSYRVYDQAILDPDGGPAFDPWRTWRDDPGPLGAVAAAILAANPHNSQPWAFAVSARGIDVFADPDRGTGTIDPFRREQHIGLGCAVENLVLAAAARGLGPSVALLPAGDDGPIARVALDRVRGPPLGPPRRHRRSPHPSRSLHAGARQRGRPAPTGAGRTRRRHRLVDDG